MGMAVLGQSFVGTLWPVARFESCRSLPPSEPGLKDVFVDDDTHMLGRKIMDLARSKEHAFDPLPQAQLMAGS